MKKLLWLILAVVCAMSFTAFGCGKPDDPNNGGGETNPLTVSMTETTTIAKPNVGVILYATASDSSATVDFTFENGEKTTTNASIGVIDGKQYVRATEEGSYVVKATATKGEETANATATITVSDDTKFADIYNVGYSPDTGHPVPSNYAHTVVGKGVYYYDNNGSCENAICFQDIWALNGEQAYAGNFELTLSVKLLPQTANNSLSTIFMGWFAGPNSLGDVFKLTRGGKVSICGVEASGTVDLSNTLYIKIARFVGADNTTFAVFTSTDGASYNFFAKQEMANKNGTDDTFMNYDLTGFNIFSQTPVAFGSYTASSTVTVQLPA